MFFPSRASPLFCNACTARSLYDGARVEAYARVALSKLQRQGVFFCNHPHSTPLASRLNDVVTATASSSNEAQKKTNKNTSERQRTSASIGPSCINSWHGICLQKPKEHTPTFSSD